MSGRFPSRLSEFRRASLFAEIPLAAEVRWTAATLLGHAKSINRFLEIAADYDSYISIENLFGTNFNDILRGDGGANVLFGSNGNDSLFGRGGNDRLVGGEGSDVLMGDGGADVHDGGEGVDRAQYSDSAFGLTVDLQTAASNTGIATGDTYISIENLSGTNFNDSLRGNGGANAIMGLDGNDLIFGRGGNDTLTGGNGTGMLTAAQFAANASGTAQDADDRIVYETDTGKLFYDSDGNAAGGSVLFATLAPGLALTNADFFIV